MIKYRRFILAPPQTSSNQETGIEYMTINRFAWPIVVATAIVIVVALGQRNVASAQVAPVAAPGVAPAIAPTPRMLAIDRGMLLRLSLAGKSIVAQAEQMQKSSEGEFKAEADRLRADARTFSQQSAILAPAVRAQKERELNARQTALQQKMQNRGGQIQAGINKAIQQVEVALGPILQQIMRERQADILVDRNAIVVSRLDIDITGAAIQRLDRFLPRVPVALANPAAATPLPAAPRPAAPRPPGH
jgi:outer membrane protein